MNTLSTNKGFSLIELMIVVAIIGILSAVAIPNFQKFQLKSRQSEAKTNLAAIFQAEKAFHQEWGQYFADWRDIGYTPEGSLKYDYATNAGVNAPSAFSGYMGVVGAGNAAGVVTTQAFCNNDGEGLNVCFRDTDYLAAAQQTSASNIAFVSNTSNFGAAAASDIDRNAGTADDQWTINQAKNLQNTVIGF